MRNLWIFGDSFSCSWNENWLKYENKNWAQGQYVEWYYNKNNKMPIHFTNVLEDTLPIQKTINESVSGADNYTILESIGKSINHIKPNDYVFIGWSRITRVRIIEDNKWKTIYIDKIPNSFLNEQIALRESNLTFDEINLWQNILLKALPKQTIFWSPFSYDYDNTFDIQFFIPKKIMTIAEETNGYSDGIDDGHFGHIGNLELGNQLIQKLKSNLI